MPNDAKRARILAAATAVFAEHDFHRVQVSHVATSAGEAAGSSTAGTAWYAPLPRC
jgi:AcrR family transcriptional regulator